MSHDLTIIVPRLSIVGNEAILSAQTTPVGFRKIWAHPLRFAYGMRRACEELRTRLDVTEHEGQFYIQGFTCMVDEPYVVQKSALLYAQTLEEHLGLHPRVTSYARYRLEQLRACA